MATVLNLGSCVKSLALPIWRLGELKNKIYASPGNKSESKLGAVVSCKGIRCQSFIDRAISVQTQNR